MNFSLKTEPVNKNSLNIIYLLSERLFKLFLEKEDKVFREYMEPKIHHIASNLNDKQINYGKFNNISLDNNIKDLKEISYIISSILTDKFKNISKSNAIKNGAIIISSKIIDIFMECFTESYLYELNSDDNKTFIENQITKGFSNELKSKMEGLINEFKISKENQTPAPMSK